jgi:hypothetical protein
MRNSRRNGEPLNKTGKTASITAFRKSLIHQIVRLVFLYSAASLTGFAQTGQDVSGMTDETGLRAIISKLEFPIYPKLDIRNRITGVAVAQVSLDTHHRVAQVDVLQAPSESISTAVRDAIQKTTFLPSQKTDDGISLTGKISFYFVRLHGHFLVLNPKDTPSFDQLLNSR